MSQKKLSRREFLESAGAAAALGMLGGGASLSLVSGAVAAPGKPIPPLSVMYYGERQEYGEFWRKAGTDLKRIGLTVKLNPTATTTVITKTKAHDFGDIGGKLIGRHESARNSGRECRKIPRPGPDRL